MAAAVAAFSIAPASAAVVSSLPGGTALPIPATNQLGFSGPATVVAGVTYTSTERSAYGYTGGYGFASNGFWSGPPMIGLDNSTGYFELEFASPISGFLSEVNWTVGFGGDASIGIYDAADTLLESLLLENGSNVVAPGYWGFQRTTADIARIRFNQEYIGIRDITTLSDAAVPEPATWAMMIAGFGLVGGAMRYRKGKQAVRFA